MTDEEFEKGGGHEFAAEVATGVNRRCEEALTMQHRGAMFNVQTPPLVPATPNRELVVSWMRDTYMSEWGRR